MKFHATINGDPVELDVPADRTLLDVLRDDLRLTGAKRGCDVGTCGSCAVIIDGRALDSCILKAADASGTSIETIEGLAKNGTLHPLQESFIKAHGFQCGVCTPGFIMSAKALLDRDPNPPVDRIKSAVNKHICRCTGYEQLIEAVQLAAGQISEEELDDGKLKVIRIGNSGADTEWKGQELHVIGKSKPRLESVSRVTGEAKYTADIRMEGMLHGATVRSERVHARILSINTEEAESYPGVVRVLTHMDVTGENAYGKGVRDQQVFCDRKVRCIGDPIALVVADTREAAHAGVKLVRVEYEDLPAVTEVEDAFTSGAPKVHEENEDGNVLYHYHLDKSDTEKGFGEADIVLEREYRTQPQDHAPIEPEAAFAYIDDDTGKLTVRSPGQSVFFDRLNIIRALGVPKDDVRCIQPAIGGAFGKREDVYAQIHAALAAMILRLPVMIEYTREETMTVTAKRTRQVTRIKIGVKKDGRITAFEGRILGDSGAYASWSRNIMRKAGVLLAGPYDIPNIRVDSYAIYTNTPLSGATRGFGATETNFCSESMMDEVAHETGIDPLEFRRINALKEKGRTTTGAEWKGFAPLETTLKEAAADFGWESRRKGGSEDGDLKHGVGMAAMWYGIGFGGGIPDTTDVTAELHTDGTATIYVGTVDYGNGSNTTFAMMAAETLGLKLEDVHVVNADSDRTKNCGSTVATKQTYTTGNATVRACLPIRRDILYVASRMSGRDEDELTVAGGLVSSKKDSSLGLNVREVSSGFEEFGRPRRREGLFRAGELTTPLDPETGRGRAWFPMAFGAQIAAVDVNTSTGKVRVKEITAAHYIGRAINPRAVRGQIVGGISMGVGFALYEDAKYVDGVPTALNFDRYKLMRSKDYPNVSCVLIEHDEETAPFGAIGIGEPPTIPTAAAIANAVYDAIGVRIRQLPITPEKVLEGLEV